MPFEPNKDWLGQQDNTIVFLGIHLSFSIIVNTLYSLRQQKYQLVFIKIH